MKTTLLLGTVVFSLAAAAQDSEFLSTGEVEAPDWGVSELSLPSQTLSARPGDLGPRWTTRSQFFSLPGEGRTFATAEISQVTSETGGEERTDQSYHPFTAQVRHGVSPDFSYGVEYRDQTTSADDIRRSIGLQATGITHYRRWNFIFGADLRLRAGSVQRGEVAREISGTPDGNSAAAVLGAEIPIRRTTTGLRLNAMYFGSRPLPTDAEIAWVAEAFAERPVYKDNKLGFSVMNTSGPQIQALNRFTAYSEIPLPAGWSAAPRVSYIPLANGGSAAYGTEITAAVRAEM